MKSYFALLKITFRTISIFLTKLGHVVAVLGQDSLSVQYIRSNSLPTPRPASRKANYPSVAMSFRTVHSPRGDLES